MRFVKDDNVPLQAQSHGGSGVFLQEKGVGHAYYLSSSDSFPCTVVRTLHMCVCVCVCVCLFVIVVCLFVIFVCLL